MDNLLDIQSQSPNCPVGCTASPVSRRAGHQHVAAAEEEYRRAAHAGRTQLVIDFNGVRYIDSTGLGVLVAAQRRLKDMKGNILLICTNKHILKLFEITGLVKMFKIFESEETLQKRPTDS